VYNQPAEDSELVECNNPGKKINDTGQPGLEARRHSCKTFHRYGCAHFVFPATRARSLVEPKFS
jgi:hypothetical protein